MPPYDPKFPDIARRMLPKTSKMTPQSDLKTRKFDFQKHVFYLSKTLLFEGTTPSKPPKETSQGIWSAVDITNTKKWGSWLQSVSQ